MSRPFLRAWADIDLDALLHNLAVFRQRLPDGGRVVGIVKADAYGHGAVPVALTLRSAGVGLFAVASLEEAAELRDAGLEEPIWHLGVPLPEEAAGLVELGVVPTVTHLALLDALAQAAAGRPERLPIHLKLDTGMGRRGTTVAETARLWRAAEGSGALTVEGLCTHFSTADVDLDFAREQLAAFEAGRRALAAEGLVAPLVHAANGSASLRLDGACFDVIRPGMALYGSAGFPAPDAARLRPVMSVHSRICQVRELPGGHDVGYAHGCRLSQATRVGLVPMGYGDGWPWRLGGVGEALVEGRRVPYLGRVNMDLLQLDLKAVPSAGVGTEVVLLGGTGEERITLLELAERSGVIDYVVSTCLSRRVTRRFRRDGQVVAERGLDGRYRWRGEADETGRGR